jgi:hypothetical protein
MASKYYFIIKLLRNALFFPPSLFSVSQSGGWIPRSSSQLRAFFTCKIRRIRTWCGGGVAWLALWRAFSQTQKLVFWWFLRSYLTSAPFSCCYFLLIKQGIFWYYSSLHCTAGVAKPDLHFCHCWSWLELKAVEPPPASGRSTLPTLPRCPHPQPVLWIRIRSDLELFAGSGLRSGINNFGSGSG